MYIVCMFYMSVIQDMCNAKSQITDQCMSFMHYMSFRSNYNVSQSAKYNREHQLGKSRLPNKSPAECTRPEDFLCGKLDSSHACKRTLLGLLALEWDGNQVGLPPDNLRGKQIIVNQKVAWYCILKL